MPWLQLDNVQLGTLEVRDDASLYHLEMSQPTNDQPSQTDDSKSLALQRYGMLLGYLGSDNSAYWNRTQLMLALNSALLGFVATQISSLKPVLADNAGIALVLIPCEGFFGLLLTGIWYFAITSGRHWIEHWETILKRDLEADAFGAIKVFRDAPRPFPRTRHIAYFTLGVFVLLWALIILYGLFNLLEK